MQRESHTDLAQAHQLSTPAVKRGTTRAVYIAALRAAAPTDKQRVSLYLFERWIRCVSTSTLLVNETLLKRFRQELKAGTFRSPQGQRYTTMVEQAPADIRTLHNRAVGAVVVRELVDGRQVARFKLIASLTPTTRKALLWFHTSATRTTRSVKPQLMTGATRDNAVTSMLSVLTRLNLRGIEQITQQHVKRLLPEPDDDDPVYRRTCRLLHGAGTLTRACVRQGLLKTNPLGEIHTSIFASQAERDFLPPDQVDRVRDLTTVDLTDWQGVRDRLVMLLLIDTAVRRNELAAIEIGNVRLIADGSYQLVLPPAAQKMGGKSTAYLGVLYPETTQLLEHYLRNVRSKFKGTRLIVDRNGQDATGAAVYAAVVREGERLKLQTYYSHARPGPHALRRSFATLNAAPLGLALTATELADRLRSSAEIITRHYVVGNPLRSAMTDSAYRQRLVTDPAVQAELHIKAMERLGIDTTAIRQQVATQFNPVPSAVDKPVAWMSESEATTLLMHAWNKIPAVRTVRAFYHRHTRTCRMGLHGGLRVDGDFIRSLVADYVPITQLVLRGKRVPTRILVRFRALAIGKLVLIRRVDVADALKAGLGRGVKPPPPVAVERAA